MLPASKRDFLHEKLLILGNSGSTLNKTSMLLNKYIFILLHVTYLVCPILVLNL